jgi:hypothetical protein
MEIRRDDIGFQIMLTCQHSGKKGSLSIMDNFTPVSASIGGALIGLSAVLFFSMV